MLRSFLLDQYGSRKTGLARAVTGGGAWVVDAGTTPLDAMIRDVKAGMLITRFSGGRPNDKGDFSGIAKNSYYIENGAMAYPISETMVSGNMASAADEHRRDLVRARGLRFGYLSVDSRRRHRHFLRPGLPRPRLSTDFAASTPVDVRDLLLRGELIVSPARGRALRAAIHDGQRIWIGAPQLAN